MTTFVGGRLRDMLHPSQPVGQHHRYLLDVHTAFSTAGIGLQACAYAHNVRPDPSSAPRHPPWAELLAEHPRIDERRR